MFPFFSAKKQKRSERFENASTPGKMMLPLLSRCRCFDMLPVLRGLPVLRVAARASICRRCWFGGPPLLQYAACASMCRPCFDLPPPLRCAALPRYAAAASVCRRRFGVPPPRRCPRCWFGGPPLRCAACASICRAVASMCRTGNDTLPKRTCLFAVRAQMLREWRGGSPVPWPWMEKKWSAGRGAVCGR